MFRLALASLGALGCALAAFSADQQPPLVERQLAVQSAMAAARKHLDARAPAEAIAALEKELTNADGNKGFLDLLREAYRAELAQLEKTNADPARLAQTRRKLALLGEPSAKDEPSPIPPPPSTATAPVPNFDPPPVHLPSAPGDEPFHAVKPGSVDGPPGGTAVAPAIDAFKGGDFAAAEKLFANIGAAKLTPEQKTAWGYCRIKLAAERVNAPGCDAAAAAEAVQSVTTALDLVTTNPKLLGVGREVLKAAQAKAGTAKAAAPTVVPGDAIETASFRVRHGGDRELGDAVAKAAEAARKQIFERWSGPPGGAWEPKCEIVIHATADAYAQATGKPAALTGHATVRLAGGRATERRIDLRADDALIANALPRELTHVVLADMFADKPPPKWALEGMAILAGSSDEIGRYTRTLGRCSREGELRPMAALLEMKDFPADKITGFYCQSVSVTDYLVKLGGERNFKIFLGDAQRYGVAQALKRQYHIDGPQELEVRWKRACLEQTLSRAP
jgi:hypothetical protein